jgi:hypothetical protein
MDVHLESNRGTLVTEFLDLMQEIGELGLKKFPNTNFEKMLREGKPLDLEGRNCIGHIEAHLWSYQHAYHHDHFHTMEHQLAAAAFNLMMEYLKLREKK